MKQSLFWSSVGMALDTLRTYKLRSFLTVLGVIIGTGTIIGVGSIITGMDESFANAMRTFGSDTMVVFKFAVGPRFGNRTAEERMRKPLTFDQAQAIRERCPHVERVTAGLLPWRGVQKIRFQANDYAGLDVWGADPSYSDVWQVDMIHGRFYNEVDNQHHSRVVVLGQDVAKALFASADPSGKWVDLDGQMMEVIGVMKPSGTNGPGSRDNRVVMPYWTMRKFNPAAEEHMLFVQPMKGYLPAAMDEVRGVLRQERRVKYDQPDNFSISTSEQMIEDFRKIMSITALVMVVLSSIGLLVGGIGVMNIMLVSVTERTREIGVRKALGARRSEIITQFMTEAVVLTFLGGLIGMAIGWLIPVIGSFLFPNLPMSVPIWAAVVGVGVSVGVGLFFGIWPANKAAKLDPVEALRYE
ncbi:ABC transporter permease [Bryobacter aggregatus]|uniref:ABC transporter permease n=1 Tax=Bryobacter aggregatus TaxID=360054 RepID=UPI0004E188D7|nr:ABC transporter permease [Bryobacter aggregatus]